MPSSMQKTKKGIATTIKQMVFGTSVSVLLIASISFFAMEWYAAKQGLLDRVSLTSELMAEHLTAAVSFGDRSTAERLLSSLRNDSDIKHSAVITEDQQIFAAYPKALITLDEEAQNFLSLHRDRTSEPEHQFTLSKLYLLQVITLNEQAIGTLLTEVSLKGYWMHMALYLTLILALVIALIYALQKVSTRIQKSIAKPIDLILQRMQQVQNKSDYSIRIEVSRSDELGEIMHQFNNMVAKVELRDQELVEKSKEIEKHAFYDPLTGLPNRRLLSAQLEHEIQAALRTKNFGAVFYIDLDNFKTINDSLGHDTGDRLLTVAANRIKQSLRDSDICARIGGDEFLAVLPSLNIIPHSAAEHAFSIAEQLRKVLTAPIEINGRSIHSSASIGISMFGDKTESAQDILKQADMAMYAAKQSGRDCSHFFSDAMQEEAINRLNLEEELREALLAPWEHFELFYQLQVDRNGHATGAEALIRWHHPEHGLVLPCTFIPLAELTGLIIPLGNWVIEAACKQLASWQEQGKKLNLAVNVSSNQFLSDGFSEFLENQLIKYKINPLSLEIEITESLILDDKDKAVAVMLELRKHGITFSIDDFGTGYSSLQYLTTLPISKLKIDQSFVRDITTDEHDAAVVKTIILMTENLGMQVIAEGVEAEIEHQFLIENGCGLFQGYLFSEPVDIDTFNAHFLSDEYVDVARNH